MKSEQNTINDLNFQTPVPVCEYMANMVPSGTRTVLEPTPGIGNLVKALEKRQFDVLAPNDFFLLDKRSFARIVMNPPFSHKSAFLDNAPVDLPHSGMAVGYHILNECMQMSDVVIALMPWFTISSSDKRLRTLKKFGLKSLTALPRKTFQYARIQTVVMELNKGYKGETVFKAFGIPHENQFELL